jgi:hypothetical protein
VPETSGVNVYVDVVAAGEPTGNAVAFGSHGVAERERESLGRVEQVPRPRRDAGVVAVARDDRGPIAPFTARRRGRWSRLA